MIRWHVDFAREMAKWENLPTPSQRRRVSVEAIDRAMRPWLYVEKPEPSAQAVG